MAQANQDSDVATPTGWESTEEWATAAVRGANNWLVTLRNATDEGIDPWSDEFSDGENGIMSRSEGLTALALVKQFADASERPGWQTLRSRYYRNDLQQIIDDITAEGGPLLRSDPYLERVDTDHFTVAATFSTSAIIESLLADVDFGDDISEDDLKDALETNVRWLIDNKIETVETDDAAGWAWVGEGSSRYEQQLERPRNYFTYSASLVLSDLVANRDVDVIDAVVTEHEAEILTTIEQANTFLLEEYWDGTAWTVPSRPGETVSDNERLLSTCYAFVGLSYIEYYVDEIALTEERKERMGQAMNWALGFYEENPDIWATTIEYPCGDDSFVDGSAPYVLLDAIVELVNWRQELDDHMTEYNLDDAESIVEERLTPSILDRCWAGDPKFEEKGFRHIKDGGLLLNRPDGAPETNPTAIYSTTTAIETFLLNFLAEGEEIQFETRDEIETPAPTPQPDSEEEATTEPRQVDNRTINNIILDGEGGDYPTEVTEQLSDIRSEVQQLSEEIQHSADREETGEATSGGTYEKRNLAFMDGLRSFRTAISEEYDDNWVDVTDDLGKAKQPIAASLQQDWEEKFKRFNTELFVEFLSGVYFCPDTDSFEEDVMIDEDVLILLLPPQREVVDEVREWDEEDFADADARKSYVEETVANLTENPWGGEDITDVVHQFSKRFQEENS